MLGPSRLIAASLGLLTCFALCVDDARRENLLDQIGIHLGGQALEGWDVQ